MIDLSVPQAMVLATFAANVLTLIAATGVAALVRRRLTYWPAVTVLATTQGLRGLYQTIAWWPLQDEGFRANLLSPIPSLLLQGLVLGGLIWTLALVVMQNRVDNKGVVDVDGRVRMVQPPEARQDASRALVRAAEIERERSVPRPKADVSGSPAGPTTTKP